MDAEQIRKDVEQTTKQMLMVQHVDEPETDFLFKTQLLELLAEGVAQLCDLNGRLREMVQRMDTALFHMGEK